MELGIDGPRNRHSQGRVAGEIHCDGVLDRKDVRLENAYPQVEQRQSRRRCLEGRERDDIDFLENAIEGSLPRRLFRDRAAISRRIGGLPRVIIVFVRADTSGAS
jgi:hypothetical protein